MSGGISGVGGGTPPQVTSGASSMSAQSNKLLNPQTGHPVFGLSSVSVVANHCMVAGSISTIAMLKGEEGKSWLEKFVYGHLWVDGEGQKGGTLLRGNNL